MTHRVDITVVDLDQPPCALPASVLSGDERDRAARFRFAQDRDRFVAGRVVLRRLLGQRLGVSPSTVRFSYGPEGKPAVDGGAHFNVAHCGSTAAIALADVPLGLDLEVLRPGFADDDIAERFFAADETQLLRGMPQSAQEVGFFRCWTRKESVLKAHGGGLQIPLDSFTVSIESERAAVTWMRGAESEAPRWTLLDVSTPIEAQGVRGAVAAVAARHPLVLGSVSRW